MHIPGGLYHVMLRGNGGQPVFFDRQDRSYFYHLLQQGVDRYSHRIHAYCLMGNHIHMAIQVGEVPLSKVMHNLSFRYTRWINDRHKRTGHVFQGRYKALLVDADAYLLELIRYIHLNPVKAGMVERPELYISSSHRTYLGEKVVPWLTTDWVLAQFSEDKQAAMKRYASFVSAGLKDEEFELPKEHHADPIVDDVRLESGYPHSIATNKKISTNLQEVSQRFCNALKISVEDLCGPSRARDIVEVRAMLAWIFISITKGSFAELGTFLQRDASTLCRAFNRIERQQRDDREMRSKLEDLRNAIMQA